MKNAAVKKIESGKNGRCVLLILTVDGGKQGALRISLEAVAVAVLVKQERVAPREGDLQTARGAEALATQFQAVLLLVKGTDDLLGNVFLHRFLEYDPFLF